MKLRRTVLALSFSSLTLLTACGGASTEPATGSTTVGGAQPVATAGGGQGGAANAAGRKKASTAKLPASLQGMAGKGLTDDGTITSASYTSTGTQPKVYLATLKRIPPMGDEASSLDNVKTIGDATCGVLGAGEKSPVCMVMLDGGMLSINGGDPKETPDQLATFAQALYDSFA